MAEGKIVRKGLVEVVAPVYTNATGGTTLEYDLEGKRYRSHTFTSNGTFEVTAVGNEDRNQVDYLIIAGGGGGGNNRGGGGGAGGFRTTITPVPSGESPDAKQTVTATTYGVTIGSGGTGATTNGFAGNKGTNSSVGFATTITAEGGGFGGGNPAIIASGVGGDGGSGGGGNGITFSGGNGITFSGGTGTTGQGRNGGAGAAGATGGGGGGAGAVGVNASENVGGNGGNGLANLLRTGSNETRAGGGGGGAGTGSAGSGGSGGGGNGAVGEGVTGSNGTVNTGSGAGGGSGSAGNGGDGGSGIVIIRYEIAPTT